MQRLSAEVQVVIHGLFEAGDAGSVGQVLAEECGEKLPLTQTDAQRERIQLAVLKLSEGDPERLVEAVLGAQRDWRDTLVAAGFAHDLEAHHRWAGEIATPQAPDKTKGGFP
jgi:hypothetical protein